jgi:shikimate dehydrogenase
VLGRPIGHSLSPALHAAAYRALGLTDWSYQRIDCGADELAGVLAGLGPDWAGLSLTMPLKRVALELADESAGLARAVGAANTLLPRPGGGWLADNTDVAGIVGAVRTAGDLGAGVVVVLGAGGTAQAALAAAAELGRREVVLVVRAIERATATIAAAGRLGVAVEPIAWGVGDVLAGAALIISTVPAGVADLLAVPTTRWPVGAVLLDAVYDPWPTALAVAATAAGCRVVGGLEMLLHQAARQVTLMTGRPAPIAAMRAALPAAPPPHPRG